MMPDHWEGEKCMSGSRSTVSIFPTAAILAAILFWGSSFSAMKVIIAEVGPWTVMWVRMAVALLVIIPFLHRLWPLPYRSGDWKLILPFVLFQPCLYFTLEANALRFTSSSQAGLISASVPLLVALGSYFTLGEKVNRATVLGLLISVGGVVWLTLAGDPSEAASDPVLGNLLEFGAMVTAAGYVLLVKRLSEKYSPWALTAMQIVTGFLFFMPGAVPLFTGKLEALTFAQVGVLVYLGACVTLGAFGFYNYGIAHIPANRAATFVNLIPVVAVMLGWSLLGETLNGPQIAAALCVLAGVWLSQWGGKMGAIEIHDV
jgi:drug/metabolite transporter (DMT)-like permease